MVAHGTNVVLGLRETPTLDARTRVERVGDAPPEYVVPYALDPDDAPGGLEQFLPESLAGTLLAAFPSSAVSSP